MPLIKPEMTPPPVAGAFPATITSWEERVSAKNNPYVSVSALVEQGAANHFGRGIVMTRDRDLARFFTTVGLPDEAAKAKAGDLVDFDRAVKARVTAICEPQISEKDGQTYLNIKSFQPLNGSA